MNIATGKLNAPIEKQASILDAITDVGAALAKNRGSLGALVPGESYALSAGLGAGTQQLTNRLLRGRMATTNPKLLKALELTAATAAGGGSGLAGALAAPLSTGIVAARPGSAARQIAELTAMGAGAELALSPVATGLTGGSSGALNTIGKMLGGGALALGGQVAKDQRQLAVLKNLYQSGARLPRGINPAKLDMSIRENAKARFKQLGIPEGGILGTTGLGLMATGNPYLGAAALLSAPLKNKTTSKYMGDVLRHLRAGSAKANEAKKTKDVIDGLYKSSSYNIKLAAPVYATQYCLDAPTLQKQANIPGFIKGIGEFTSKAYKGTRNRLGSGIGRAFETARESKFSPFASRASRAARRGRSQVVKNVNTKMPNQQNPAAVGEAALLQETGRGASTVGTAPTPLSAPTQQEPTSFLDAISLGRQRSRYKRRSQIAETEEGYQAFEQLGDRSSVTPASRNARNAQSRLEQPGALETATQQATTPQTQVPGRAVNFAGSPTKAGVEISEASIQQLERLATPKAAQDLFNQLKANPSRTPQEEEVFRILRGYSNSSGQISRKQFGQLKTKGTLARTKFDAQQTATTTQAAEQQAINQSPLTAPVQAGERYTAAPVAPTQEAAAKQVQEAATQQRELAGGVQGFFQYRPGGKVKGTFTSGDQGLEIANIRFADSQLGQDLIAIEGKGGLSRESLLFRQGDIVQAQTKAAKQAQLHTAAEASTQATNALNAELSNTALRNNPQAIAEVNATLSSMAKSSEEVTADSLIKAVNAKLGGGGNTLTAAEEAVIKAAFTGNAGTAFTSAQKQLDGAMARYNSSLKKNLEASLVKIETQGQDTLRKTVNNLTTESRGIPGVNRQAVRSGQEVQHIQEVQALAETRARILRESGTIADRTQAAEMMRLTEEALRSGSAEEIKLLRDQLARPTAKLESSGTASGVSKLFDTPQRRKAFSLTNEQSEKFRKVVKMEGRGAGDQTAAVREIFSTQAARSPESAQGMELSRVVTEAAGGDATKADAFLSLGRQEGAGGSAFNKLTSGNKAGYSAEGYTVAELQAMGATPQMPAGLSANADAAAKFEEFILNGRGTLSENLATLDKEISSVTKALRGAKNPTQQATIQAELRVLQDARGEVGRLIQDQNRALKDTFAIARNSEAGALKLVKNDTRMGNVTLLNDAGKVELPRNLNLDSARTALNNALTSDPAQHRTMVSRIFTTIKNQNPSLADDAIAQRMINEGLISGEQLVSMGGANAFAQGTASQAGGGVLGTAAGVAAAGGVGALAMSGRGAGTATQAKEKMERLSKGSAWGLSPLHAPVMVSKLASPVKPIPLNKTLPKLPDPMKMPAQSLLTATVQSQDQAMKMSSILSAPVRAY